MQDKILSRIEELSKTIMQLVEKRQHTINDLHRMDAEIDSLSMVVFELKSLLDDGSLLEQCNKNPAEAEF